MWRRKEHAFAGRAIGQPGGMAIALDALGDTDTRQAVEQGIDAELMHRVATISSATLDALPHNGPVLTVLQVSGLTHRESYFDMVTTLTVGVILSFVVVIVLGSVFGSFRRRRSISRAKGDGPGRHRRISRRPRPCRSAGRMSPPRP